MKTFKQFIEEEGKSVFSTPGLDDKIKINKWMKNNEKLYQKWGIKKA